MDVGRTLQSDQPALLRGVRACSSRSEERAAPERRPSRRLAQRRLAAAEAELLSTHVVRENRDVAGVGGVKDLPEAVCFQRADSGVRPPFASVMA